MHRTDIEQRVAFLQSVDLFALFSAEELASFALHTTEISLEEGDILFTEGSLADDMYVLTHGCLRIFKNARTITTVRAIDYVGEMAIIEAKPRSASVAAIEPCTLLKITAAQFKEYFSEQPRSLVALMRTLSRRIRTDTEMIAAEFEKANILIHDMRNLLCSFLYLDLMAEDMIDDCDKSCVRHMIIARRHLNTMMEEALANAKRLYHPYTQTPVCLGDLLVELAEAELRLHPDMIDKHFAISIDGPLPSLLLNSLDIRRVIANLVLNAAQASKTGGTIMIEARRVCGAVELSVRDEGVSIPASIQARIFEPHFTTRKNGTGLGLASCKEIIERRHRGVLAFSSMPGQRTTFTIRLPIR